MMAPRIFVDFQNTDQQGRVRLNCAGTFEDLSRQEIELKGGLLMSLYSDDCNDKGEPDELTVDGVASYSESDHCWVAIVDWTAIRHSSDNRAVHANGLPHTPLSAPIGH